MNKLLPVHREELAVFVCLSVMMFLATFVHGFARILKDALVLSHSSAEMLSALKVWVVWPASITFILVYMKLSDSITRTKLYHGFNLFFVAFFLLYVWVIYPHYQSWRLHLGSSVWVTNYPAVRYLVMVVDHWPSSCFYMLAEMWSSVMSSVLTWEIANHITSMEQSKRFYSLYGTFRSLGLMAASLCASYEASRNVDWGMTLHNSIYLIVVAAMLLSLALTTLCRVVGFERVNKDVSEGSIVKKRKPKVSLLDSIRHVLSSKTILLITLLILCYGISINLVEGVWKKSMELYFAGQGNQLQHFIGRVNFFISFSSVTLGVSATYLLNIMGWRLAALVAPMAVLVSGSVFFVGMVGGGGSSVALYGIPFLKIAIYAGATTVLLARATKNSFFDSTKEMVYIPLSAELRTKGKAAAETIGMRFGKGGGAVIQQLLLAIFSGSSLLDLAPFLGICLAAVLVMWFYSVFYLDRLYSKVRG